jgi:hypothetical protein
MRRVAVLLLSAALCLGAGGSVAFADSPPPVVCQHHDSFGRCIVTVHQPGGGSGGGGGQKPTQSCRDVLNDPIPCSVPGLGYWVDDPGCYLMYESPQPPKDSLFWQGHTDGVIYRCTSWPPTTTGMVDLWFPSPPVGPEAAALRAEELLTLPQPSGHRSPNESQERDGHPYTYVNLWTWYWTDASTWKPLSATARAGGVSATVTVTPKQLVFDAGDGSQPAVCDGPGRPWTSSDGNAAPADGGCGYRYTRATSSPITSTQSIVWGVTWTSSGGSSGSLADLTTSQAGPLMVLQIETVVSR